MPGKKPTIDHKGNVYPSVSALAKAYNIGETVLLTRLDRGWTLEAALTTPSRSRQAGPCTDHLGNTYPDRKAMCAAYGISYGMFRDRIKAGWDLEAALTTAPIAPDSTPMTDPLGKEYPSLSALAKSYGMTPGALSYRLQSGLSMEEALTRPHEDFTVKDAEGTEYKSAKEMANAHGIAYNTLTRRLRSGMEIDAALTNEKRNEQKKDIIFDGTIYTIDEFCEKHHISRSAYYSRLQQGIPIDKTNSIRPTKDFNGIEYPSTAAMCRHYKVNPKTYKDRVISGWSLKDSLLGREREPVKDYKGIEYPTIAAMCRHYKVHPQTFKDRFDKGWPLKECLLGKKRKKKQPNKSELIESRKRRNEANIDHYWEHVEDVAGKK